MIPKHSEEFINACIETGIQCKILSEDEKSILIDRTIQKFTRAGQYNYPLWESLIKSVGITFPFAWEWFDIILKQKEVVFFFEPDARDKAFKIEKAECIPLILQNSYRFTFYITDYDNSFLFCYNDHDNLIAAGDAELWLLDFVSHNYSDLLIYTTKPSN